MKKATKAQSVVARPAQRRRQGPAPAGVTPIIEGLSPRETRAFEKLTSGASVFAAANAAQVSRKTVYEWLKDGHTFAAAYNLWKATMAENTRTRLLILSQLATSTISSAIRSGDARIALQVVRGMGLLAPPAVGEPAIEPRARIQRDTAQRRETLSTRQRQIFSFEAAATGDDEWSSTDPETAQTPPDGTAQSDPLDAAQDDPAPDDVAEADDNPPTASPGKE